MSVLSQFFPSGGNSNNIGGGTVPVEILGVSGGGGGGGSGTGGSCNCQGGAGGMGAFFYAHNYYLNPGTTYPVTVGGGGAGGTSCSCPLPAICGSAGSNGGYTSFNNTLCPLRVEGGGGGGGGLSPAPGGTVGLPGGTGGGGGGAGSGGKGLYYNSETIAINTVNCEYGYSTCPGVSGCVYSVNQISIIKGEYQTLPWGIRGGFPGGAGYPAPPAGVSNQRCPGAGGGMISNEVYRCCYSAVPCPACVQIYANSCGFNSNITGSMVSYGSTSGCPGSGGVYPSPACAGGSGGAGVLVIRWPSDIAGAAPSFPGATDLSPSTPGFYTYCFTSSGSITLP